MKFWYRLAALASLLCFASSTQVQAQTASLDGLISPRAGKVVSDSSYDRKNGNDDFVRVAPGQTVTLVNRWGEGVVRRLWLTIAPWNNVYLQRQGIIRCYWDGEASPSVEVPVADFFGMGFGEWKQYISQPLSMTSGGFNCYWAMPFHKSARITFENRSSVPIDAFYFNVAVEMTPVPKDALYFHAQFRRTISKLGKPIQILQANGRGHYVGTLLSMQPLRTKSELFLEGDEQVFVDGETRPSIQGTGTEDYFNSGWYFNTGVYSSPYHGVTLIREGNNRINAYRWHVQDPIPFRRSLLFQIEHGPHNDTSNVYYSSVAYWYQTHPHAPFPPLPSNADLLPPPATNVPKIAGLIEAEDLLPSARATKGRAERQEMNFDGSWSENGQLWWREGGVGDTLKVTLAPPKTGRYELVGYFTRAKDYGDISLSVNGQTLSTIVSGYDATVRPSGPISLGTVELKDGANEIEVKITGKDARSQGTMVGIDGFRINPQ